MKRIFGIVLIGLYLQFSMYTQASARGEIPPPPPFTGGNTGDWLGSGPIFGFEGGNGFGDPWKNGGGSNGGWGGSWWDGRGPLGSGGNGGWTGWGSGSGPGGYTGYGDLSNDSIPGGHGWPITGSDNGFRTNCFKETMTGGFYSCVCQLTVSLTSQPQSGQWIVGQCMQGAMGGSDQQSGCSASGLPCSMEL